MTEVKTYPIAVELKVYITDGRQVGSATYTHGMGRLPTEAEMPDVLQKVTASLPDGFRLMNRAEASMHYLREERGYRGPNLVVPRGEDEVWHDPATDKDWSESWNHEDYDEDEE